MDFTDIYQEDEKGVAMKLIKTYFLKTINYKIFYLLNESIFVV